MAPRPEVWSECSCVIRIASNDSGDTPRPASRSNVSLRLSPASTNSRVREVATSVQLPLEEDASTETETIGSTSYFQSERSRGDNTTIVSYNMKARVYVSF